MGRPKKEENNGKKIKVEEQPQPRRSIKEIMDAIIDTDSLTKRKENAEKKAKETPKSVTVSKVEYNTVRMTFDRDKFTIKSYKGKYYVHYATWSDDVYAGPYETESICQKLVDDYIGGNGKKPMEYEVPNIHSIVLHME